MRRSKIDRLFRLWDALYYFRYVDRHDTKHLRTRNRLKRALLKEYNLDAHGLRPSQTIQGCIILAKPARYVIKDYSNGQ